MKTVFGIGNPLLDIVVDVEDNVLLDKYNLRLDNAILVDASQQGLFDDVLAFESKLFIAGGAAANAIRAAQWMLPVEESATYYAGCIGADDIGENLVANLSASDVRPVVSVNETVPTGRCACVIKGKERSLAASVNAAETYVPEYLESESVKSALEASDIVYTTGFFIASTSASVIALGKFCHENNKIFSLNISAEFVTQYLGEPLAEAISYADYVFCNETEAAAYAKSQGSETTDIAEIAKMIANVPKVGGGKRWALVTCGSESTIYTDGETVHETPVTPVDSSLIVDTNGAGDSFVGGFLAGLAQEKDLETCVLAGHSCAGFTIQRSGTNFENCTSEFNW